MRWLSEMVAGDCGVRVLISEACGAKLSGASQQWDGSGRPLNISSKMALFRPSSLGHSVDTAGYTHYCYNYQAGSQDVEAPTLRVNRETC